MPLRLQLPAPTQGLRPAGVLILIITASQATKAAVLTTATMICFAANSLLCRLALGPRLIDPASFTTVRVLAAVVILVLVVWQRYGHLPSFAYAKLRSVAALFVYLICFSFAYVRLTAGTGVLILFTAVQLTMFCVALREGERFSAAGWIGLSIASLGLIYLVLPGVSAPDSLGAILIAMSGIAWGVFSLSARQRRSSHRGQRHQFPLLPAAGRRGKPVAALRCSCHVDRASLCHRIRRGGLGARLCDVVRHAEPSVGGTGGLRSTFRPCHRRDRRCALPGRAGHAPIAARLPRHARRHRAGARATQQATKRFPNPEPRFNPA